MQETHRAEGNANNSRVINEKPRNPIVILIEMAKGNVRNVFLLKSGGSCGAISRKQGARYIHRADSLLEPLAKVKKSETRSRDDRSLGAIFVAGGASFVARLA